MARHSRAVPLVGLVLLIAGCVVAAPPPRPVAVAPVPPPPVVEVVPAQPGPAYVWIAGHWAWRPRRGRYVWVPGRWALPPGPRQVWVPGHWVAQSNGYVWLDGHWELR